MNTTWLGLGLGLRLGLGLGLGLVLGLGLGFGLGLGLWSGSEREHDLGLRLGVQLVVLVPVHRRAWRVQSALDREVRREEGAALVRVSVRVRGRVR